MKRQAPPVLLALLFVALASQAAHAGSVQVGLPGYLVDPEKFAQATPQEVFRHLQEDDTLSLSLPPSDNVALVKSREQFRGDEVIFFTKWAYPSVMRLRRVEQDGVWATRVAFLCGAAEKACRRFEKLVRSRETQVAPASEEAARSDAIRKIARPLPKSITGAGANFYIVKFGINPDLGEYAWRSGEIANAAPENDAACTIVGPVFGAPPQYPSTQLDNNVGGKVMVRLLVDGNGKVVDVAIRASSRNRDLDRAAMGVMGVYRFNVKGCRSASSRTGVIIPVAFHPGSGGRYYRSLKAFDASSIGY